MKETVKAERSKKLLRNGLRVWVHFLAGTVVFVVVYLFLRGLGVGGDAATLVGASFSFTYLYSAQAGHRILRGRPLSAWIKRIIDVAFVAAALITLVPLIPMIALLIKVDSPGPVLYRQYRVGYRGELFEIIKFRTTTIWPPVAEHSQMNGPQTNVPFQTEPRITRVGRLLRRTGLDSLPILLNVIKGEMSLVGPWPFTPFEYDILCQYRYHGLTVANRVTVPPGITGWAQVSRLRGQPLADEWEEMLARDAWYVEHHSLLLDLRIVGSTVVNLVSLAPVEPLLDIPTKPPPSDLIKRIPALELRRAT